MSKKKNKIQKPSDNFKLWQGAVTLICVLVTGRSHLLFWKTSTLGLILAIIMVLIFISLTIYCTVKHNISRNKALILSVFAVMCGFVEYENYLLQYDTAISTIIVMVLCFIEMVLLYLTIRKLK